MVIFFEWHRTAVDQKSCSGLPMTGEDTGLGALASPLAGYLGKVQERAASLEQCPWCTAKGLTYALRSYRINLKESITLCTNPQCLFPLVSRSLEDVLASVVPVEPVAGKKRKNALPLDMEELIKHSPKRPRSSGLDRLGTQCVTDTLISAAGTDQHSAAEADGGKVNGYHRDVDCMETAGWESLKDEDVLEKEPEDAACAEAFARLTCSASAGREQSSSEAPLTADGDEPALSPHCGVVGVSKAEDDSRRVKSRPEAQISQDNQSGFTNEDICSTEINIPSPQLNEHTARTEQTLPTADITACNDIAGIKSETEDSSSNSLTESEELASAPSQLFWWNKDKLCWLDSLLVALVKCKSLRRCKPRDEPQQSPVWQLMKGYDDVCAAIQGHQHTGRDGVMQVPKHVLQKANADLQSLRMSVFKLLQPKLHCKLGQRETPVFALPLLLAMDSWAEPLFQSTFRWEFKCSECKAATKERLTKTLPTFTNLVPDWRPLHAVHFAPCNLCRRKNERRTMMLESVSPVFVLHFVEGLPDHDVTLYTFSLKGKRYSVTTVIQYSQKLKHFVTWVQNSDGSWLEYDDLKHPDCETRQRLPVPAQEMHLVFWEAQEEGGGKEPRVCSPSSTFPPSPPPRDEVKSSLSDGDSAAGEPSACSPDQSLLAAHDMDVVSALSAFEEGNSIVDGSIGSTTLLDTFEGLSHDDIVTLTLVELKVDSEMQPVNDSEQTQNVPSENETPDAAPDSSSTVTCTKKCPAPDVEHPATPSVSDPESEDGSSSDPTFVPGARRGRGRGRGTGRGRNAARQKGKKAAPRTAPPVSSEPCEVIAIKPTGAAAEENTPTVETTQQTPPSESTHPSPLSTSQTSPTAPPALDQNARWSFLLSRHPMNHKSPVKPAPTRTSTSVTRVKLVPPAHSTPNPVRRQQPAPDAVFPKPQLRTEGSAGLPLKAAEMYGAFGAKSSNAPRPLPPPALISGKPAPLEPTSHHQKSQTNTTVAPAAHLPALRAKGLPEISSSKKQSSQSTKVPPGLSDTEALRYKLMKKLKAKKKKLAKLNELLGHQGGAGLRPDSTGLTSPNTVTSSTYDGSACDDFLSDLLSPATTASNLSPDSTGFLEMLAKGQDGVDQLEGGVNSGGAVSQVHTCMSGSENFLDEFLSQAVAQRPTEMESEALSALELFI